MTKKHQVDPDNATVLSVMVVEEEKEWFEATKTGLFHKVLKKPKDGEPYTAVTKLTHHFPFEVLGFLRPVDGAIDRGLLVRARDDEVTVRRSEIANINELRKWIANHDVFADTQHMGLISRYLQLFHGKEITAYTKAGWQKDGAFNVDHTILRGEGKSMLPDDSVMSFAKAGTFEDWERDIMPLVRQKPGWVFCYLFAMTSALLKPLNIDTGAFVNVHGHSRTGKTVGLRIAASAWGHAFGNGTLLTFEMTENAIEGMGEAGNDVGLFLDEMERTKPEVVSKIIYKFANGQGKKRYSSGGTMQRLREWRCNGLATSEKTIEGIFDSMKQQQATGQIVRALDIEGEMILPDIDRLDVKKTERAIARCYGVAGLEFVRRIMGRDDLHEVYDRLLLELYSGDDGSLQTVASTFALVKLVGEIMGEDTAFISDMFELWVLEAAGVLKPFMAAGRAIIDHFDAERDRGIPEIVTADNSTFDPEIPDDEGEARSFKTATGWWRREDDEAVLYLLAPQFKVLIDGVGPNRFYTWLKDKGCMDTRPGQGGNTVRVPGRDGTTALKLYADRLRRVVLQL